jgi:hypothetical protein
VLAAGAYVGNTSLNGSSAPTVFIHGGGATLSSSGGTGEPMFSGTKAFTMRDLELTYNATASAAINASNPCVLERLKVRASDGLHLNSQATVRDLVVEATSRSIVLNPGAVLTLDRATLSGGSMAIHAPNLGTTIMASNVLASGSSDVAFNLPFSNGTLAFITIANSGASSTTASGIVCGGGSVAASIVWTPGSSRPPIMGGCVADIASSIAGPVAIPGAANTDPLFVGASDFHLTANSPAKDLVDGGPATDFEGGARPQGLRFDIGADEAQ